ncbi:MAG: hypothetical protein K8T25_24815 [Planctomycetia bacterium]|nr:hypothetical protein [Planctomycetia bacterium]
MISRKRMMVAVAGVCAAAWMATRCEAGVLAATNASPQASAMKSAAQKTSDCAAAPKCETKSCEAKPCEKKCCAKPCIEYRTKRPCRKACCDCGCDCKPPQKEKLTVKDPCCCTACPIEVPVCLPACCKGKPCVSDRCGVLGRGVVTYTWCNGYTLTVTFKNCGDVLVTYYGS